MEKRPDLTSKISSKDFQEFYWLKEELTKFCRAEGLKVTGSKIDIRNRIIYYLETGNKMLKEIKIPKKTTSKFDWKNEKITTKTLITDNYKNTENIRLFFQQQIGKHFKFKVKFMNWMRINSGKTLGDAIEEWKRIHLATKSQTNPKIIAPQFEYNRYLRDFLADNPNAKRATGIKLWNLKKSLRGDNKYKKEDLKLFTKTKI